MMQKWKYTISYSSIDESVKTFQQTCTLPFDANIMFQYISNYVNSKKWDDEYSDYVPTTITFQGRTLDTLTYAKLTFLDRFDKYILWEVANRCIYDEEFADKILKTTLEQSKSLSPHEQKEYKNEKRCLREHKKKGKNLHSDYCYFVGQFNLYKIVDFNYELL